VVAPRRILDGCMTTWRSLPIASRRWLVRGAVLLLIVDGLLLLLTSEPFLTWFAYRFRAEDPPAASDAIVFLLGALDRSPKAADLYRRGLAPVVLMCPTDDAWDEAERHRRILRESGVPAEAIRILPGEVARSTHDEALRVRDYLRAHPARTITVVTSAYHTARARWTFRRVLRGTGVEVRMAASEPPFDESDWFRHDEGIRRYLAEAVKTIYYRAAY
jgi:uncharacterized SAM-binding protein YcdF (DUF218 family)